MKKIAPLFVLSVSILSALVIFGAVHPAAAVSIMDGVNAAHGAGTPTTLFGGGGIITTIANILLFIAGALAVIMIIYGGLRYVTSAGNSTSVTAAKNTILYAIVGLIIALLAFAVVNFVLGSIGTTGQVAPSTV